MLPVERRWRHALFENWPVRYDGGELAVSATATRRWRG